MMEAPISPITIGSAADYQEKLRACHVIVDHEERQNAIRSGALSAAADAGLTLVPDEGLVIENAGLTEWPVPLLGRFDEAFLDVPPEVIQLTARVNQKYFVCEDGKGKLANAFVCTANIEAADGGAAIVDGNRKVLAARLSDARFFWEQDRKVPLSEQARKLERITFHEKLGTVADKVERMAKLARWLVEEGIVKPSPLQGRGLGEGNVSSASPDSPHSPTLSPSGERENLADLAEQAARLCKADLVTEMVGEFPELQGLMGGYYVRAEGLPDEVADAIRDHYKPVGQGDLVPTAPVTVAVSLADKLDTLFAFFTINEAPTGSKDPYALRRAMLAILAILMENEVRANFADVFLRWLAITFELMSADFQRQDTENKEAAEHNLEIVRLKQSASISGIGPQAIRTISEVFVPRHGSVGRFRPWFDLIRSDDGNSWLRFLEPLFLFALDRLKVQQRANGLSHDVVNAGFAVEREGDFVRTVARVNALQHFIQTEDGANLLAAYKRAANILKKEDWKGAEGEIARTGEEDPLALVDDPDLKRVVEARLAEKKKLSYTPEPAEKALIEALDSAEPKAAAAVRAEDFEAAMAALASLRAPIDKFFDEVTVNDPDPARRSTRLDLLGRFRDAVHQVADFSKIEG